MDTRQDQQSPQCPQPAGHCCCIDRLWNMLFLYARQDTVIEVAAAMNVEVE